MTGSRFKLEYYARKFLLRRDGQPGKQGHAQGKHLVSSIFLLLLYRQLPLEWVLAVPQPSRAGIAGWDCKTFFNGKTANHQLSFTEEQPA